MYIFKFVRILYGCSKDFKKILGYWINLFQKKEKARSVCACRAFCHNLSDTYLCNKLF